jgi:putative Mg2+ transporter-C (MgtC) family protein
MSTELTWSQIALRLACTLLAGILVGLNRGEHGHTAGLRTTILVCLAASVSMIQVNLLLPVAGKAQNSFVVLDLMRLPLGILSGMGFIGAGAILRRGRLVEGVTTAATLWFVTVLGLCFGGGQIAVGSLALLLGLIILTAFKWVERHLPQDRKSTLTVEFAPGAPSLEAVTEALTNARMRIQSHRIVYAAGGQCTKLTLNVVWRVAPEKQSTPEVLQDLAQRPGISRLDWLD